MMQGLPRVIPINELKNTAQIAKTVRSSEGPIIVTKNGYGEMVLMSVEVYEQMFARMQSALLINESLDEIADGAELKEGKAFFAEMRAKYGK